MPLVPLRRALSPACLVANHGADKLSIKYTHTSCIKHGPSVQRSHVLDVRGLLCPLQFLVYD